MVEKIKKGVEYGQHIALCFTIMGAFGAYMVHQRLTYKKYPYYRDWN
jgi:hypothetical protein|tara:strand:- start:389 stop:529 length:141 start_codon:yes stop_codon:yes gene_type:complete